MSFAQDRKGRAGWRPDLIAQPLCSTVLSISWRLAYRRRRPGLYRPPDTWAGEREVSTPHLRPLTSLSTPENSDDVFRTSVSR